MWILQFARPTITQLASRATEVMTPLSGDNGNTVRTEEMATMAPVHHCFVKVQVYGMESAKGNTLTRCITVLEMSPIRKHRIRRFLRSETKTRSRSSRYTRHNSFLLAWRLCAVNYSSAGSIGNTANFSISSNSLSSVFIIFLPFLPFPSTVLAPKSRFPDTDIEFIHLSHILFHTDSSPTNLRQCLLLARAWECFRVDEAEDVEGEFWG
jgi:hypothetical protein